MAWTIVGTSRFEEWFTGLDEADRARVEDRVDLLEQLGPTLGRPSSTRSKQVGITT